MLKEQVHKEYNQQKALLNTQYEYQHGSIGHFVEAGLTIAEYYEQQSCNLLQELFLKQVFDTLLNNVCDTLLSNIIRQHSLDQIYKPLLALKRFYKQHDLTNRKYFELEHNLRVLSHEFNPYR